MSVRWIRIHTGIVSKYWHQQSTYPVLYGALHLPIPAVTIVVARIGSHRPFWKQVAGCILKNLVRSSIRIQVIVEVRRALLMICPTTLAEEKKTVRRAPAYSQRSFLLLYYPLFSFFCFVILFLCLTNITSISLCQIFH